MSKFQLLFEVKFFHKFYDGFTSKDFEVVVLPETALVMKGHHLMLRDTPEGFLVMYDGDKQYLIENLREALSLSFGIKSTNKHFQTFSKLVPINKNKKYFFSNLTSVKDDKIWRMHEATHVDDSNHFAYALGSTNVKSMTGADELVITRDGVTCFNGALNGNEICGELMTEGYGWYDVSINNGASTSKLHYLHAAFESSIALLDVSFGGPGEVNFESLKGSQFQISFDNRPIFWTYYFVSDAQKYFESVQVFSGKEKLPFSAPEKVKLPNGQASTKVTSLNSFPIELSFTGKQMMVELNEQPSDVQSTIFDIRLNLPTPNVTRIKGKREGETEFYFMEMFVYV